MCKVRLQPRGLAFANSSRLIKFTVQGVRFRLDRIYLEALQGSEDTSIENDSYDEETQAMQEELESLYSEILPVAQMSVEQRYLIPARRMISSNQNQGQHRSATALEYVCSQLPFRTPNPLLNLLLSDIQMPHFHPHPPKHTRHPHPLPHLAPKSPKPPNQPLPKRSP